MGALDYVINDDNTITRTDTVAYKQAQKQQRLAALQAEYLQLETNVTKNREKYTYFEIMDMRARMKQIQQQLSSDERRDLFAKGSQKIKQMDNARMAEILNANANQNG